MSDQSRLSEQQPVNLVSRQEDYTTDMCTGKEVPKVAQIGQNQVPF